MKSLLSICLLLLQAAFICCQNKNCLTTVFGWSQMDFIFPNLDTLQKAVKSGQFVKENAVPIDVDVDYQATAERTKIFVTIPRFSTGVPVTLGTVSQSNSLLIQPYPDYSWHSSHGKNCDRITSAFRVAIDECRNLWVLDSGKIGDSQMCPPALFVFDLKTDKLVRTYKFPKKDYVDMSLFVTPIVDVNDAPPIGSCANVQVYIADVGGFAVVVYDLASNKSWRVQNKLFYPYPNYGTFWIAGDTFDLMDGVLGMSVSPKKVSSYSERVLYFHALSSGVENSVPLSILNNAATWNANPNANPRAFKVLGSREIQTAAEAMDSNGNLYFVLAEPLALACWDISTPYNPNNINIIVVNNETLQFASGLKIVRNRAGKEEIWILTNRFQKIAAGTLKTDQINFRIQVDLVSKVLRGSSKCNGTPLSDYMF